MEESLTQLQSIFERTKKALVEFTEVITPVIENAQDDHERLYWHHIYEEEDHRLDRLQSLLPKLESHIESGASESRENGEVVRLLQDISLEKFGLHNFLEHLDLSLYTFKGGDNEVVIQSLRDLTARDYEETKHLLNQLNTEFEDVEVYSASTPTDEKEDVDDRLKAERYTSSREEAEDEPEPALEKELEVNQVRKNRLTVGSLKY